MFQIELPMKFVVSWIPLLHLFKSQSTETSPKLFMTQICLFCCLFAIWSLTSLSWCLQYHCSSWNKYRGVQVLYMCDKAWSFGRYLSFIRHYSWSWLVQNVLNWYREAAVCLSLLNQWLFLLLHWPMWFILSCLLEGSVTGTILVIHCTFVTILSPLTFTVFQHMISSGANHSSTRSEANGSGATTSLKSWP